MSSQPQKTSRWGTFLSSVESRLDTILADEDPKVQQKANGRTIDTSTRKETPTLVSERSSSPARSTTPNRAQERLNERLARAVASKNLGKPGDSTPLSSGLPSRTGSPANAAESPRPSSEFQRSTEPTPTSANQAILDTKRAEDDAIRPEDSQNEAPSISQPDPLGASPAGAVDPPLASGHRLSLDSARSLKDDATGLDPSVAAGLDTSQTVLQEDWTAIAEESVNAENWSFNQVRADKEAAESRWKEESQKLLEKIDALQAKLLYLTKEAVGDARKAAAEAKAGSVEQKLAEKDEKIALLIEEGQKLSQTELKYMNLIKKLRSKTNEDEKLVDEARRNCERLEKATTEAQEKARRAVAAEKQSSDRLKGMVKVEKELDLIKKDRDSKEVLIQDLQFQLSDLTSIAKQAEEKARADALEEARKKAVELEDNLSNMKMEKEFAEREHQNGLREMREKAEREKERAKVTELERQGELSILESKLETYRARAEEASAGQGGDVQAKLLRQIETLQNQYAVASENWQGIEGSHVSRISTLERERDEMAKREAELRQRAREINTKNRRLEEEVERISSHGHDLDAERTSLSSQTNSLREQLNRSEAEFSAAREEFKAEREEWEARQTQRLEEERAKMREECFKAGPASIFAQQRTQSPVLQMRTRRSSNAADHSSPQSRRVSTYQNLASANPNSSHDRTVSRHSSVWSPDGTESKAPAALPLNRTDSMSTVPNISLNNGIPETPSIDYDARPGDEDFFGGLHTPTTPPERTINDIVSASTAAGPSVQLVERMSAAVRRLESEKAAHKDEMVRLLSQRDEAREQVVELMRDNEGKKAVDTRLELVEKESAELEKRYETTLEMLGEKSERVEELKADIVDLKAMMREMVEERVK